MLEIKTLTLGPVQTNTYLVADSDTRDAAVIDPAWDGKLILSEAQSRGWRIAHLWYTHAHFDHIGGAAAIADAFEVRCRWWLCIQMITCCGVQAAAVRSLALTIDPGPEPTIDFYQGQILKLGSVEFEVRFTPGHTTGHCVLYVADTRAERSRSVCFCGDLIFNGSVGRTDLPGGDWDTLVNSIKTQIFTLPDETRLLSGHGPETTVGQEKQFNPFVGKHDS